MIEAGHGGAILNISSVRANLGINAGYSAYVAAKGAISSLTRQWATEWAKHGIHVNAIMPTFVDTPQVASLLADPAFKAGIVNRIPLGRVGETRDLVGPAIFLCSDAASFVTGQVLGIDGGLTATPVARRRPRMPPPPRARARHPERLHDDEAARLQPELRRRRRTGSSSSTRRSSRRGRSRCAQAAETHGPIRYLINTENHVDHIFGNCWFRGAGEVVNHQAL